MVGPTLLAHCTDEQRSRFLPAMLRGDEVWCQLFSETEAGSDLANLTTRAVLDGDDWVVTGHTVWTSSASRAEWGNILVRTDPDVPRPHGLTSLRVYIRHPGHTLRPRRQQPDAHPLPRDSHARSTW